MLTHCSDPRLIGVECKFYTAPLSLGLARAFIGLGTDLTAKNTFFVTNTAACAPALRSRSTRDFVVWFLCAGGGICACARKPLGSCGRVLFVGI